MPVNIRKMTDEEFEKFYQWSIGNHVRELMEEMHISQEEAFRHTKDEVNEMLPNGMSTENNYLMTIENNDTKAPVGFVWTLHEKTEGKEQSFLCDFIIFEPERRKGYATEALKVVEKEAAEAGCKESVLFVADTNYAARDLYKKCGYQFLRSMDDGSYMIKQL